MQSKPSRCFQKRMSIARLICLLICCLLLAQSVLAQGGTIDVFERAADPKHNRSRGLKMLEEIKQVIKKDYYDQTFHGIDIEERFKVAAERIKKMDANWQIFRVIAQVLLDFNDSHTRFFPPARAMRVEYGFTMQMIGNDCYVVDVKKGTDAEAQGIKPGDTVLKISG